MEKVLLVKDLYKEFKLNFKTTKVLHGINIELNEGEVFGFLGPNGAGKTTTMKIILDFISATKGEVLLFGQSLKKNREILKNVGYAPEQAYYYDHLTGEEFLYFMGKLSGLNKKELNEKIPMFLDKMGLSFAGKRYIKTYSKGMKQRLGLASAIIHNPKIVFFDEPMSGLDPLGRNLVKNIIRELKEQGITVFFNTHILSDVQEVADRFAIINKGRTIYQGNISDISGNLEDFFVEQITKDTKDLEIR